MKKGDGGEIKIRTWETKIMPGAWDASQQRNEGWVSVSWLAGRRASSPLDSGVPLRRIPPKTGAFVYSEVPCTLLPCRFVVLFMAAERAS